MEQNKALAEYGLVNLTLHVDTFEDWQKLGEYVQRIPNMSIWWLGDWWNWGKAAYGERAQQAALTGFAYQTLCNAAWVAKKFPPHKRRPNVSWSVHAAIAVAHPDEQDRLLDKAEAEGLTKKEVRLLLKKQDAIKWDTEKYIIRMPKDMADKIEAKREVHAPTLTTEEFIVELAGKELGRI